MRISGQPPSTPLSSISSGANHSPQKNGAQGSSRKPVIIDGQIPDTSSVSLSYKYRANKTVTLNCNTVKVCFFEKKIPVHPDAANFINLNKFDRCVERHDHELFYGNTPYLSCSWHVLALEFRIYSENENIEKILEKNASSALEQQHKLRDVPARQSFTCVPHGDYTLIEVESLSIAEILENKTAKQIESLGLHHATAENWGAAFSQGECKQMEDVYIAKTFTINTNNHLKTVQLFGVFDGHNGSECAEFVHSNLVKNLKHYLEDLNKDGLSDRGILSSLKVTMAALDNQFAQEKYNEAGTNDDSNITSGTTANIAIILNNELWVANVGDSRCLLVDDQGTEQLSRDIKPEDAENKITKRFGTVNNGAVSNNGASLYPLGVSTAIGESHLISVSARPKVSRYKYDHYCGKTLVQVTKGVTCIANSDEIGEVVLSEQKADKPLSLIAARVVSVAHYAGSQDNKTCLVTKLPNETERLSAF